MVQQVKQVVQKDTRLIQPNALVTAAEFALPLNLTEMTLLAHANVHHLAQPAKLAVNQITSLMETPVDVTAINSVLLLKSVMT